MKNLDLLIAVARDAAAAQLDLVFFGGTVVGLHLDQLPPDDEERPTVDVDCMVLSLDGHPSFRSLEQHLTRSGWSYDMRPQRRNAYAMIAPCGVPVDLVPSYQIAPQDPVRLGKRQVMSVAKGLSISVLDPASMLAAMLAAFQSRGIKDPLMSHDLEDAVMLLSCCSSLEQSIQDAPRVIANQIGAGLSTIFLDPRLLEIVDGSVPSGVDATDVFERLRRLARQ